MERTTTSPYIAAVCDQSDEVVALVRPGEEAARSLIQKHTKEQAEDGDGVRAVDGGQQE